MQNFCFYQTTWELIIFSYGCDRLMGNVYLRKHKRQKTDTKITSKEEEEEVKEISGKKQGGKSSSEDEKRRGPEQRVESFPL